MSYELRQALERVARRFRQVRLWAALAFCWLLWGGIGAGLVYHARTGGTVPDGRLVAGFVLLAVLTGLASAAVALRSARDRRWVARRIEARHPDLGTGLLAAVEEDATARGKLGYLQMSVVRQALEHRRRHDWDRTVPNWKLRGAKLAHAAALALLIVVSFTLAGQARSRPEGGPLGPKGSGPSGLRIEPGNAEIERGTPLLVVARFEREVPAEATLLIDDGTGSAGRRPMTRSLEDPTFAGRVDSVEKDLSYRVEYAGRDSDTFRITVFEYPEVVRADAHLEFPSYTSLESKTVEDVRHVTAVEGTLLTLSFRLNKDVATARLIEEQSHDVLPLAPDASGEHVYAATFTLAEPRRFRVELTDPQGRPNKSPTEIAVNVIRNKPPNVAVTQPAKDVRVSPVEELSLAAKFEDDFGVVRHGLAYSVAGKESTELVLSGTGPTAKKAEAAHLLDFESFAAEPDQLVTYYFWAEDVGPDGQTRRASGDMFFAEVRPFEEIFRQGQQPSAGQQQQRQQQGQQGNAQQAAQLAELQKQIINGTWKLIRRETGSAPSEKFASDADTLRDSQKSAINQAAQLAERLQDPTSKSKLDQAAGLMNDAVTHLTEAADSGKVAPLQPALVAEQSAYQALLKLRDREFQVVRGQQQQQSGGSSAGGPSQQQLQQLELSNEENRYEQRRSAQPDQASAENQQQAESRQVLNRLRELAQRQADLNERLKELQSALEAAQDEQTKEELRRQLKRLRDQEQQILRDTDELRERMESEQNRERMADARQQVEQGRENVRRASEALEEGRVSQALTEGTRAGRQFDQLKEELRKETSNRFAEEMTEMRDAARRLDEAQDRLSGQLEDLDKATPRSLRDGDDRKQIREGLEYQQKELGGLLDRMRETVRQAEEAEPLLAEKLYDTVRDTERKSIPDALRAADRLTDLGIAEEAAKASRKAGEGIGELRQGVEKAAESVLGDETQMLKRAQGELENLADAIDREIARAGGQPNENAADPARSGRNGQNPQEQSQPGGRRQGEGSSREGDPERRNGEQGSPRQGESQDPQNAGGQGGESDRQAEQRGSQDRRPGEANRRDGKGGDEQGEEGSQRDEQGERPAGRQNRGGGQGDQPQQGGTGREQGETQQPQQGERQGGGDADPQQSDQQGGRQRPGRQQGGGRQQPGDGQGEQQDQQDRQSGPGQAQGEQQGRQGPQTGGRQGGLREQPGEQQPGNPRGGQPGDPTGDLERLLEGGIGSAVPAGPITGEGFRDWSDRMRDVEELLDDPELSAEAARIRDRVRGAREEFKRHSKEPDPEALHDLVAAPLHELRDRVAEEVRRREAPDSLVPIDRDPVPPAYAEGVRRYYERLGSGR